MTDMHQTTDKRAAIRAIWAALLSCSDIPDSGDFYDLGGDSIAALNMAFQVSALVGKDLSPALLFENPTLGAFCTAVLEGQAVSGANGHYQEGII